MTGSEEGDPRTKGSLGKFDKVRVNTVSCGILFIENSAKVLANLTFPSLNLVLRYCMNSSFIDSWCSYSAHNVGSAALNGKCH